MAKKKEAAGEGHNSRNIAGDRVRSFVERIERLNEEADELKDDINEVLKEAEHAGFDKKIIKTIVKIRKDKETFEQDLALVNTYMHAMGQQLHLNFDPPESSAIEELSEAA